MRDLTTIFAFLITLKEVIIIGQCYNIPSFTQQGNISASISSTMYDSCRFFQIYNSMLYRLGDYNVISSWNLSSLFYTQQTLYQTYFSGITNVSIIGLGKTNNQMMITLKSPFALKKFDILNLQTLNLATHFNNVTASFYTTIKVQSTQTEYLQLLYSNISTNYLNIYNKSWSLISSIDLDFTGLMNSTLSQDESALIVWNLEGQVRYIDKQGSTWVYYAYYTPYNNIQAMNSVSLSKNGTFAILEYDSLSPFTIVNFRDITTVSYLSFSNTVINQAFFLDQDCHLVALTVNYSTLQIYDTLTLTIQSSIDFPLISNYSALDYSTGKLYFCLEQNITSYKISCPSLSYRSSLTNECIDCILSANCISCDSQTGFCSSCQSNFTLNSSFQCQAFISITNNTSNFTNTTNLSTTNNSASNTTTNSNIQSNQFVPMSLAQGQTINATIQGFKAITPIIKTIFSIIQMSPFALIFISFMNYWNLCCLYSILDVNVPSYLPQVHQEIFDSVQTSIFSQIGFNPQVSVLNNYNVSQNFYVNYQISLDAVNPNIQNVLMTIFVLSLIFITVILRNIFLNKSSFMYKYLKFNIIQTILGQFISFVPFCILPYKFLIAQTGSNKFTEKVNNTFQIIILMLCFSLPLILIWSRSQTYIKVKTKKDQKLNNKSQKTIIIQNKIKLENFNKQSQNSKQFLMFVVNITVPFLIILPNYIPFFTINLVIFICNIKVAYKSAEYRINNIISSFYLPLYHSCYILFYLFGQNQFINHYVGLFCLIILFLGGIHELCNVLIITLIEFIKWIIKHYKSSKVQNQSLQKQDISINDKNQTKLGSQNSKISLKNNKIANCYQENTQNQSKPKIYKSFKKRKGNLVNLNKEKQKQERQSAIIKSRIRAIKFKIQKSYKKGLSIDDTSLNEGRNNDQIKSFNDQRNIEQLQTNNELLRQRNIQKANKSQINNSFESNFDENSNISKLNQFLKEDYQRKKTKYKKALPKYTVL